ncbi:MAG: RHS repeat protein [Nitrospira sp. LK70]|nr:RHS repeat protein [Nitrospira sp. LK70]
MGSVLDLAPPATVTDPLSHTTTFGYDTKGNLTTITNALSKTTTITVNSQGQPLTIKDPLNNITTFTYELGDLISVKDPLNRKTQKGVRSCTVPLDELHSAHGSPSAHRIFWRAL